MTWAVAAGPDRVRFIADHGSRTLANLGRERKASLQVIGRDNILALIKGTAAERRARVAASPFGMALWELIVTEVRDQAWGPVAVTPLAYAWQGPQAETLRRMEQAVLEELRTAD